VVKVVVGIQTVRVVRLQLVKQTKVVVVVLHKPQVDLE
jgi:hypothetical protein